MGIRVACIVAGLGLASVCRSATPFDGDIAALARIAHDTGGRDRPCERAGRVC